MIKTISFLFTSLLKVSSSWQSAERPSSIRYFSVANSNRAVIRVLIPGAKYIKYIRKANKKLLLLSYKHW